MGRYKQGYYTPVNKEKYRGDVENIRFLSSWEFDIMRFLDNSENVVEWNSEETIVHYMDTVRRKKRKYYIDFYVMFSNGDRWLLECKPVTKLIESKCDTQAKLIEHKNIMDKKNAALSYCRLLREKKGLNIRYGFITKVNGKYTFVNAR